MLTTILILIILFLLVKVIKQGIRINGYEQHEDFTRIDNTRHLWDDGDPCRCSECTERYQKEVAEDLKKPGGAGGDMSKYYKPE